MPKNYDNTFSKYKEHEEIFYESFKKTSIAIIPARGGSKRIKNKNLIDFCGKPLLQHTIDSAKELFSNSPERIVISTDDLEIEKLANQNGCTVVKRPDYLASDYASSEDVIKHALWCSENIFQGISNNSPYTLQNIVFMQATSPLRKKGDLMRAAKKKRRCNSLFSACTAPDYLFWNVGDLNNPVPLYRERKRSQDRTEVVENGSFYMFDVGGFKRCGNRLFGAISPFMMENWQIHEIDSEEEIEICEYWYNKKIKENNE